MEALKSQIESQQIEKAKVAEEYQRRIEETRRETREKVQRVLEKRYKLQTTNQQKDKKLADQLRGGSKSSSSQRKLEGEERSLLDKEIKSA